MREGMYDHLHAHLHYEGNVIRPPNEGGSILLQVTVGCTHNACAFCGAYTGERFRRKSGDFVLRDLDAAARLYPDVRRLFLCDGDVLSLPMRHLVPLLGAIRERLPWVTRVGTYGNAHNLRRKTAAELAELRGLGLATVYMGLESGDDAVLTRMNKGATAADMIAEGRKVREAGLKLSVTVLLGLGGVAGSARHAELTGRALSAIDPENAAALTLMLVPGTPLFADVEAGRFALPDARGMLRELRAMVEHTELSRGLFLANHASNHLPIKARLPRDKAAVLVRIDAALDERVRLVPEPFRRL